MLDLPDRIPINDNAVEFKKTPYGSMKQVINKKPKSLNYKQRANKSEAAFIQMVEERKKIQDLILESCLKIEESNFECDMGKLNDYDPFRQLKSFARGVPHITRVPLDEMPLDGKRMIKAMNQTGEVTKIVTIHLHCGHTFTTTPEAATEAKLRMNEEVVCTDCKKLLIEREMYQEKSK